MSATVIFSVRAEKHVENIALELADRSRRASREFVSEVRTRVEQLAQFPESGHVYDDETRRVFVRGGLYSLLYEFDDVANVVTIIGCFNNRSDAAKWSY